MSPLAGLLICCACLGARGTPLNEVFARGVGASEPGEPQRRDTQNSDLNIAAERVRLLQPPSGKTAEVGPELHSGARIRGRKEYGEDEGRRSQRQEHHTRSQRLKRFDAHESSDVYYDPAMISGSSRYQPSQVRYSRAAAASSSSSSSSSSSDFNAWKTLRMRVFKPQVLLVCRQVIRLRTGNTTDSEVNALFALGKMDWGKQVADGYSYTVLTFNLDAEAGETWVALNPGGTGIDLTDGCGVSATATPSQREVIIVSCRIVMVWRDMSNHTVTVKGTLDYEVLLNLYSTASGYQLNTELVSVFVVGGKSPQGHPQVWELAFSDLSLTGAEWRNLTISTSVSPKPRVLANLHYSYPRTLILYGGSMFPTTAQWTTSLCDLWEFNLTAGTWTQFDTLEEDCKARTACENTTRSYIFTRTLSVLLPASDMLVTLVSQCEGFPHFEVWMLRRGPGHSWAKTPNTSFSLSKNGGTPQLSYAVGSFLVANQKDAGYLVIADYTNQETKVFSLMQLASDNGNQSAILLDINGRDNYFIGSTGCQAPPPISLGLFVGGTCSPVPAMLDNARSTPTLVWSRTVDLVTLTSQWTQNSVRPAPLYGNRIGQSVVKVTKNGKEKALLFGGLISIDFLRVYVSELFFVPNELWCFDYTNGYRWQQAVLTQPSEQPSPRAYQTTNAIDDVVYMFGGMTEDMNVLNELWRFEFTSFENCEGKWANITSSIHPSRPPPLYGHSATLVGTSLYMLGGAMGINVTAWTAVISSPFVLDLVTLSYQKIPTQSANVNSDRIFHSTTRIGNRSLAVLGGCMTVLATSGDSCFQLSESFYVFLAEDGTANVRFLPFEVKNTPPSQKTMGIYGLQVLFDQQANALVLFGGVLDVKFPDVQFGKLVSPNNDVIVFQPGCPPGHASPDLMHTGCTRCPIGTYSGIDGTSACTSCQPDITTNKTGCTTAESCSVCQLGVCGHGSCVVDGSLGRPSCKCDAGYWSFDNCNLPVYFIIGAAAAFVFLVVLAILLRRYHRKSRLAQERVQQLRQKGREIDLLNAAWQIEPSELTFEKRLDKTCPGGFGEVHLCKYRDMYVAVKKLNRHSLMDADSVREFHREVEAMRTIRHPNVVLFLGAGSYPDTQKTFLVMEYVRGGTLMEKLADKDIAIEHPQRLRFALDVAKAMRYLHNQEPPRIHRDLKSCNLLVSESWTVKVADFGTSRRICERGEMEMESSLVGDDVGETTQLLRRDNVLTINVGTRLWMSPEVLARRLYDSSTDVYSFGIILWEIYCRKLPYSDMSCVEIPLQVMDGHRPPIPTHCPEPFSKLMKECWAGKKSDRPKFVDIVPRLESMLETSADIAVVITE